MAGIWRFHSTSIHMKFMIQDLPTPKRTGGAFACLHLVLAMIAISGSPSAYAQTGSPAELASIAVQLYMDTCVQFQGSNADVSSHAARSGYARASEDFSRAALKGKAGEVWNAANAAGEFVIVLTGEAHCSVWARTADARTVNGAFEKLVKGASRRDVEVVRTVDRTIDGAGGQYRQLGYLVRRAGAPYGWLMLATTSASENAEVQARLTMSPAKP